MGASAEACKFRLTLLLTAPAQCGGRSAVALQAERAHVGEIAFAATLDDGDDVIGIPEMTAKAPFFFKLAAGREIEFALVFTKGFGVEAALGADAVVSGKDLLAEIGGIGAESPFVDAGRATESESSAGD